MGCLKAVSRSWVASLELPPPPPQAARTSTAPTARSSAERKKSRKREAKLVTRVLILSTRSRKYGPSGRRLDASGGVHGDHRCFGIDSPRVHRQPRPATRPIRTVLTLARTRRNFEPLHPLNSRVTGRILIAVAAACLAAAAPASASQVLLVRGDHVVPRDDPALPGIEAELPH